MKATGIVRKIDDLGRLVIPKEIRRVMGIKEHDPVEIFRNDNGDIVVRKYDEDESVDLSVVPKEQLIAELNRRGDK